MSTQERAPENKENLNKAKKTMVYFGMFSVVMFFAGLTSAYIVSMGDSFWLKSQLPQAFWISTTIILLSSAVYQFAIFSVKKGNLTGLKIGISVTFLLGLSFIYFQFRGYSELSENGIRINQDFFVDDGYYGYNQDVRLGYFDLVYQGNPITTDGYNLMIEEKVLEEKVHKEVKSFMAQFADQSYSMWDAVEGKEYQDNQFLLPDSKFTAVSNKNIQLLYRRNPVIIKKGKLYHKDSIEFLLSDKIRLRNLANNVRDGRGDFFVKGKMGVDFKVFYTPKVIVLKDKSKIKNEESLELEYVDRQLKYKNLDANLSEWDFHSAMEAADTASAYLYMITFMHLLHIIVTMFYLTRVVIRSFTGKITSDDYIGLKMGGIFWHFLGALWVYLLLFLLFIH